MGDERFVLRGTRLLAKSWKPKVGRIWPGPVAGYLLGHVEEQRFLEDGYADPGLEARRLASAHFWVALKDPRRAPEHYDRPQSKHLTDAPPSARGNSPLGGPMSRLCLAAAVVCA